MGDGNWMSVVARAGSVVAADFGKQALPVATWYNFYYNLLFKFYSKAFNVSKFQLSCFQVEVEAMKLTFKLDLRSILVLPVSVQDAYGSRKS